ncbi:MAG: DUF1804 family protein [Deltaproteobacteria bacterium]|nr:DUF1804 family protein [Deltaproteobacteria bacterium]
MGSKGDRQAKEGLAKDLYAEGLNLEEISGRLDISVTSLSKWKKESKSPDMDLDDWDLARQTHRDFVDGLRKLFREQMEYVQKLPAKERTPSDFDALSKAASIVRKYEEIRKAEKAENESGIEIDRPALFLENLDWLARTLKDLDPEGLKVLARNFDCLIVQFKAEFSS